MRKNVLLNTALVLVSLAAVIAILEWAMATFYPQATVEAVYRNNPAIFAESGTLPYALRPNTKAVFRTPEFDTRISINSLGYRGNEFSPERSDKIRILTIGDSFTFGHGVNDDETYSSQLEQLLGDGVEVINAGYASCYSPETYYLYLKESGLALRPDVVVVGFFIGNDIDHPNVHLTQWVERDERGLPTRIQNLGNVVDNGYWVRRDRSLRYSIPIARSSHLFQFLVDRLLQLGLFPAPAQGSDLSDYLNLYRNEIPERTLALIQRVKTLFLEMDRMSRDQGATLVAVMIPELGQVDPSQIPKDLARAEQLEIERPQRLFSEFFDGHGIRYLDLMPAMRAQGGASLYFAADRHWNRDGHRVAADEIATFLREQHILAPEKNRGPSPDKTLSSTKRSPNARSTPAPSTAGAGTTSGGSYAVRAAGTA